VKQWISPLLRTRKLAQSRELQKMLVELYPASLIRQKQDETATKSKRARWDRSPVSYRTGRYCASWAKRANRIRKNVTTRICQKELPLCLPSFMRSAAQSHPWCSHRRTHLMREDHLLPKRKQLACSCWVIFPAKSATREAMA